MRDLTRFAAAIRKQLLLELKNFGFGHLGGSMSIVELLAALYGSELKHDATRPHWEDRDYLILSKGHAGPAWYATLALEGYFPLSELETLNKPHTNLPSHPDRLKTIGVDMTSGSLGQGPSVAAGLCEGFRIQKRDNYVYVVVGDGELNEGQPWEAFQYIASRNLHHCIVFIDENKKQLDGTTEEIIKPFDFVKKMEAFGFSSFRVDGKNPQAIKEAIQLAKANTQKPTCIVLDTIKGQGVKHFEAIVLNHVVRFSEDDIKATNEAIIELDKIIDGGKDL